MPVTKSAKKALKQDRKRRLQNLKIKRRASNVITSFKSSPSERKLVELYKIVDMAAKKNIYHQNKASRLKSNMAKLLSKKGKSTPKAKKS